MYSHPGTSSHGDGLCNKACGPRHNIHADLPRYVDQQASSNMPVQLGFPRLLLTAAWLSLVPSRSLCLRFLVLCLLACGRLALKVRSRM